jgi:hypothetical protein
LEDAGEVGSGASGVGCKAETRLPHLRDDRHDGGISAAAVRDDAKRRRTAVGGCRNSCVTDCLGPLRDCRIGVWGVEKVIRRLQVDP